MSFASKPRLRKMGFLSVLPLLLAPLAAVAGAGQLRVPNPAVADDQANVDEADSGEAAAAAETTLSERGLLEVESEGIVVVGSRTQPRSVSESMVPIDVLAPADF